MTKQKMLDKINDQIDEMIIKNKIDQIRFNKLSMLGKIIGNELIDTSTKITHSKF